MKSSQLQQNRMRKEMPVSLPRNESSQHAQNKPNNHHFPRAACSWPLCFPKAEVCRGGETFDVQQQVQYLQTGTEPCQRWSFRFSTFLNDHLHAALCLPSPHQHDRITNFPKKNEKVLPVRCVTPQTEMHFFPKRKFRINVIKSLIQRID